MEKDYLILKRASASVRRDCVHDRPNHSADALTIIIALGFLWNYLTNFFRDLPTGAMTWLLLTLIFLLGSISFILSPEGKKIVRRTRTIEGGHESKRIWNLGSLFRDHTAYWDNRDGFVLRVARVCAETAESPWTHELPDESDFVDKRAAWRVGFLRTARWISGLTWLVLGVSLWDPASGERTRTVQSAKLGSCSAGSARSVRGARRVGDVGNLQCVVLDMEVVGFGRAGDGAGSRTARAGRVSRRPVGHLFHGAGRRCVDCDGRLCAIVHPLVGRSGPRCARRRAPFDNIVFAICLVVYLFARSAEMSSTRCLQANRDADEDIGPPAMSAIGTSRPGSSTFRLSTTPVSMSLTGSRFSSDSAPGPATSRRTEADPLSIFRNARLANFSRRANNTAHPEVIE